MIEHAHSIIGPSKSDRWMPCPGSVRSSEGCANTCSEAAALGTAAHLLGEQTIEAGVSSVPASRINSEISGKDRTFTIDKDMVDAVNVYTKYVKEVLEIAGQDYDIVEVEKRFHLKEIHPELFGTNDCLIGIPLDTLHIIDYKHGVGKVVEIVPGAVIEMDKAVFPNGPHMDVYYHAGSSVLYYPPIEAVNTQLLIYGVGALLDADTIYSSVMLTIVQPRAEHMHGVIRSVKLNSSDILNWAFNVLRPKAQACFEPNPTYQIGDWCRFCPAISCPAVMQRTQELTKSEIDVVKEPEKKVIFPNVEELTPVELGRIYQFSKDFKKWTDKVSDFMHEQLRTGKMTPQTLGFKRIEGRNSRNWRPGYAEKVIAESAGMLSETDLVGEPPKLSVAQVEKVLKDKGAAKKLRDKVLSETVEKTPGAPRLVPITDKGQALPAEAASAFEAYTAE